MKPEHSHENQNAECARLQASLTAYFDGHAGAHESFECREHLQKCAACARVLTDWQSVRDLYRTAPVAPPPLQWARLRLAAQMRAVFERSAPAVAEETVSRDELLLQETLFEATRGLECEPFVPVLQNFFEPVAPPSDLQARILRATVGAAQAREVESYAMIVPAPGALAKLGSGFEWLETVRLFAPRGLRWAGVASVPALAAWLIFSNITPLNDSPTRVPSAPQSNVASFSRLPDIFTSHLSRRLVKPSTPRVAAAQTASGTPSAPAESAVAENAAAEPPRESEISSGGAPEYPVARVVRYEEPPLKTPAAPATPENVPDVQPAPRPRQMVRNPVPKPRLRRPLLTISQRASGRWRSLNFAPRLVEAGITRLTTTRAHSATHPEAAASRVLVADSSIDVDEVLVSVRSERDERPEELRQMFDEYRASLVADDTAGGDELDDVM